MMDYLMFKEEINQKEFKDNLSKEIMYSSEVTLDKNTKTISINVKGGDKDEE